jgi:hypothetical protein
MVDSLFFNLHPKYFDLRFETLVVYCILSLRFLQNILFFIVLYIRVNEELRNLDSSPNAVWVSRSRRMKWVAHVCSGKKTGACRVLMGKHESKRQHGKPRPRMDDNIKMDLKEVRCGAWTGFICVMEGSSGKLL